MTALFPPQAGIRNLSSFQFYVPSSCPNVPSEYLHPERAWSDQTVFEESVKCWPSFFNENFAIYETQASAETRAVGPIIA